MEDWQLLQEYALRGTQRAFAELVARHINMVHSAAMRQVHDKHLAEDVSQAVFIILAKKANSIPSGALVSAWLLKAVRYASANALRMRSRRVRHETKAGEFMRARWGRFGTPFDNSAEENIDAMQWREIAPLLDEALDKLRKGDREAIILRYFEQRSLRDVGAALGVSEEAAKKRVTRAVATLREVIRTKTGGKVLVSITLMTTLLAANAVEAAPAHLSPVVAVSALSGTDGSFASASALPMDIANSTTMLMAWAKMKWVACGILLLILGAGPMLVNMALNSMPEQPVQAAPTHIDASR